MRRRFQNTAPKAQYVSIVFDKSIPNPANITIEDNKSILNELLSQFRRCIVKKNSIWGGDFNICYLNDKNSNYYEDGNPAILTGEEGNVMVNFPEYYYKYVKINDNKFAYRLAFSKIDNDWIHIGRSLVGAYKIYADDLNSRNFQSISGVKPSTGDMLYRLNNQNVLGYKYIDFEQHCTIALMLYAKYKTRDISGVLGQGAEMGTYEVPEIMNTGTSNSTGISDTRGESSKYVCGLGLEGIFGGIFEYVYGCAINNGICTITNPDDSSRTIKMENNIPCDGGIASYGQIKKILAEDGPFFDVTPTEFTNNRNEYYTDYFDLPYNKKSKYIFCRSGYSNEFWNGVARIMSLEVPSYTDYSGNEIIGSRLSLRGTIHEVQSSSEFKALPLL